MLCVLDENGLHLQLTAKQPAIRRAVTINREVQEHRAQHAVAGATADSDVVPSIIAETHNE